MILPISQKEIDELPIDQVREMAGILAYFFANEISKWENEMPTMPLSNETFEEYQLEFNSIMVKPGRPTILKLVKKSESV